MLNDIKEKDLDGIINELKVFRGNLQKTEKAYNSVIKAINMIVREKSKLPQSSYRIDNYLLDISSCKSLIPNFEQIQKYLTNLQSIIDKEKIKFEMKLFNELDSHFDKIHVKISGTLPNLIIPPFQLNIEKKSGTCNLFFGRELIDSKIPITINKIMDSYKKHYRLICERKIIPEDFLKNLYLAYNRVLKLSDYPSQSNRKANIVDVLNEFVFLIQTPKFHRTYSREDFKPYPRSYFLYDILKLQEIKKLTFNGLKVSLSSATIDTTGKKDKVLYFHDLRGDSRPIMAIEFVEVKK
ncbi:MAG: hypothetical protein ACTSP4_06990 [Candidatus Hodarchaeales archaeon]